MGAALQFCFKELVVPASRTTVHRGTCLNQGSWFTRHAESLSRLIISSMFRVRCRFLAERMDAKSRWRNTLPILLAVFWIAACDPRLASSCDNWNTPSFFMSATPEEVQACIDDGADLRNQGLGNLLPIHGAAASSSHPEVILQLLEAGADLEARSGGGGTALHFAVLNRNPAIVRTVIDSGAELEARDSGGMTALHCAAWMARNPAVITALVQAGAELEARAKENLTPLQIAAGMSNNPEIIEVLIGHGADPNARLETGNTALHLAVLNSAEPDVIRVLLSGGADPDLRNELGEAPLDVAEKTDDESAIAALLGL